MGNKLCCYQAQPEIEEEVDVIIGKIPQSLILESVVELQNIAFLKSNGRIYTGRTYSGFVVSYLKPSHDLKPLHKRKRPRNLKKTHNKKTYDPIIVIAKKFKHELEHLRNLQHDNIISFVGVYTRPIYYVPTLVTEEISSNLFKYLEDIDNLPETKKHQIVSDIYSALHYLHETKKVAHMNLTTKSIVMTPMSVVKISGFEYAKPFGELQSTDDRLFAEFRDEESAFDFLPQDYLDCTDGSADLFSFACVILNVYCLEWPTPDPAIQSTEISRREKYLLKIDSSADIYNVVQICLSDQRPSTKELSGKLQSKIDKSTITDDVTTSSPSSSKLEDSEIPHDVNKATCSPDTTEHSQHTVEVVVHAEAVVTQNEDIHLEKNNHPSTLTQQENIKPEVEDTPADAGQKKEHSEVALEADKARQDKYEQESKEQDRLQHSQQELEQHQADINRHESKLVKELQSKLENCVEKLKNQEEKLKELKEREQHDRLESQKQIQELQDKLKDTKEKLEECQIKCQWLQQDLEKSKKSEEEYRRKLIEIQEELKICHEALTKHEEDSFKYTNAFTTADEGSVMKLKDVYRHMQHNNRTEAARAHRRIYHEATLQLADHGMIAYKKAKEIVLEAITNHMIKSLDELRLLPDASQLLSQQQNDIVKHYYILGMLKTTDEKVSIQKAKELARQAFVGDVNKSLYQMQPTNESTPPPQSDKIMKQCMKLIDSFHDKMLEDAKHEIKQTLINEYQKLTNGAPKDIPKQVEDYYSVLARFTWDCVARTIPIVMSTEITIYDEDIHELKDKDEDEDYEGKEIAYAYPVLFTSNRWPREVAWKGSVKILEPAYA